MRAFLGDLARVAARTVTSCIRATVGERDLSVGLVVSISRLPWQMPIFGTTTPGGGARTQQCIGSETLIGNRIRMQLWGWNRQ